MARKIRDKETGGSRNAAAGKVKKAAESKTGVDSKVVEGRIQYPANPGYHGTHKEQDLNPEE